MISLQPMTLYELVSLVISTAGFITVTITLVLLMRQTREMIRQSENVSQSFQGGLYDNTANWNFAVDEIFINHPELRPYFYSAKDISEGNPVYDRVTAVADFILDFFDFVLIQGQKFPEGSLRHSYVGVIEDIFAYSPVLCRHLDSIKKWHSKDLLALMRAGEARRQQVSEQGDP